VAVVWPVPNLLPLLLPWLAVLALLALPSNRTARAWWIWAPLVGVALLGGGLRLAADAADNEGLSFSVQAACAAAFGLAAIWLLGAGLARRCRTVSIVLAALAFVAVSLLAFVVSPVWEQLWNLREYESAILLYVLLFWLASGVVFAGALNLTGRLCRKRFGRLRVALWLPLWLWVMWLVVGSLVGGVETLVSRGSFEWGEMLVAPLVLSLVSYAVILPFLILSFTSSFYRARLKDLLRLPAADASPPVPTPSPVAELGSPR
jgi:hypothetical protein